MKKTIDLHTENSSRTDKKIRETLGAEFELPDSVKKAQAEAFRQIREMAANEERRTEEMSHGSSGTYNYAQKDSRGNHSSQNGSEQKISEKNYSGQSTLSQNNSRQNYSEQRRSGHSHSNQNRNARRRHPFLRTGGRIITGAAAAAAVFSGVCIANPAWAAKIPVAGSVFQEIGDSLGFSGDFSGLANPVTQSTDDGQANTGTDAADTSGNTASSDNKASTDTAGSSDSTNSADGTSSADSTNSADSTGTSSDQKTSKEDASGSDANAFSKTADGVTVTLSEVYCNDAALYLSMLVESEDPFPATATLPDNPETPYISVGNETFLDLSYNGSVQLWNVYLDGRMLDEHTYAGVLRVDLSETTTDEKGYAEYYEAENAFLKEHGYDLDTIDFAEAAEALGMTEFNEEQIAAVGGPDVKDYVKEITVPETFSLGLRIPQFIGMLPEDQQAIPEMPQELVDEFNAKMAEHGLDDANYENFTEEEKEIERQLRNEQMNKYEEMYPGVYEEGNEYTDWTFDGPWEFPAIQVTKDHTRTITREVNLLDENGSGIQSVTRTPFELILNEVNPSGNYFLVATDADGDLLPYGNFGGNANTFAVQDRDVSKVDVYICDYTEYMDELKGYYWSDDYAEKKKTKTFKQFLDERALMHQEVVFDE